MKNKSIVTLLPVLLLAATRGPVFAQDPAKEVLRPARETAVAAEAAKLAAEAKPGIAVLDFTAPSGDEDLGRQAAELLRESLASTGDFSVLGRDKMLRLLGGRKLAADGTAGPEEAAGAGRALGVKLVAAGAITKSGSSYTANLRFFDAASGGLLSARTVSAQKPDLCLGIVRHFTSEGFAVIGSRSPVRKPAAQLPPPPPPAPAAAQSTAPVTGDVTYAQVLSRPDDIELNFAFAKTRVRQGDLKGAAAALERVLMVNPDLDAIRLFYAVVLYRLDILQDSEREFKTVADGKASAPVRDEAKNYLKVIRRRATPTTLSAGLSAGAEYDSNRNASPASGKRLFLDTPLDLTGSNRRRDDTSLLVMANAELRRVVSARNKHEAFGSFSYFRSDQSKVSAVSLQALSAKLGGVLKAGRYELTPTLAYDRVLLAREKFLVNKGGSLRFTAKPGKKTDYWSELGYAYQDNLATPAVSANPERRGQLYTAAAGGNRVLTPVMKAGAGLTWTSKLAAKDYNAYSGFALDLRHQWLLGRGRFLLSSLVLGNDVYRKADTVISRKLRKDATLRAGVTAGVPASEFYGRAALLRDLTLTLSLEYFRARSTVLNYSNENFKTALLLSYRWDAGL